MMNLDCPWRPTPELIESSNVGWLMRETGISNYTELHAWSAANRTAFWEIAVRRLGIRFHRPYDSLLDDSRGAEHASWLVGAEFNIAESCFGSDPHSVAVIEHREDGLERRMTVREVDLLSSQVAASLDAIGIRPNDAVGIVLPMTMESVVAYLGIIKAGAMAVGIAESFSPAEIGVRLRIAGAKLVISQDSILRGGKRHELYHRVRSSGDLPIIVVPGEVAPREGTVPLASQDRWWRDFLIDGSMRTVVRGPDDWMNVLFSSGTTGDPKAIPWTQTCPIKAASDGHFHQDIRPGDVVAWPTSLGWMMGPWLIFASLINRATIGLHVGSPHDRSFGRFVEQAGVTMLGVVPSLVASWRGSDAVDGFDWSKIRTFSSTGECSKPDDMRWLMERAGGRPIIEYCGGTEISGGYLASVVARPIRPSTFNSPALGLDITILDEGGRPADKGELFLIPPSIGMSTRLLNRDHYTVYHAHCPPGPRGESLRRHGDAIERLPDGYYRAHGRVDDTMNLGGVKVSAAEIERITNQVDGVLETAAVAEDPPGGGPSELIIFAVMRGQYALDRVRDEMRARVRAELNPLFQIREVRFVDALPRTASNKVMRRMLRPQVPPTAE